VRFILHIGAARCGSSSIHRYLAANASALRSNGIMVPDRTLGISRDITGEQVRFFEELLKVPRPHVVVRDKLKALKARMAVMGLHTLIVSAPILMSEAIFPASCDAALSVFRDVRIVSYIRRQDDYLISEWCRWWFMRYPSIDDYIGSALAPGPDWSGILRSWEKVFGRNGITVRLFQQGSLLADDIVEDFLDTLRISRNGCAANPERANVSMDETLIEIARDLGEIFASHQETEFLKFATELLGKSAAKTYAGSRLLSLNERRAILLRHEDGNEAVRKKYFPSIPAGQRLFREPSPTDVATLSVEERGRLREDLMLRLLKALAERAYEADLVEV